jgi:hypothetical protein
VRTEARLDVLDEEGWEALYARAASVGCGELVEPDEERVAATDELLAAALPAAARTGGHLIAAALLAADTAPLAREAAAILRALDLALAAHGRDQGYDIQAWRRSALITALVLSGEPVEAAALVDEAIRHLAAVFVALRRDRLGVSERLATAIGHMLVVYAATGGCR